MGIGRYRCYAVYADASVYRLHTSVAGLVSAIALTLYYIRGLST
nr:MAG TPA: hypothetical protein [Caudoviricetes sp.]